jgi:dissimilatory sulfite reductase (desulfoviridin) alpha/beta subunit
MKWSKEAEERIKKVPFFVRKRVRKEVERQAAASGASVVLPEHLEACRQRYMSGKSHQTPGYEIEQCFGADGCPNSAVDISGLAGRMEDILRAHRLKEHLLETVKGPLKMHHAFRVSISNCPNACSRPQIVDFGLIGASLPAIDPDSECTGCGLCRKACREEAIVMDETGRISEIDDSRCLYCGGCIRACKPGTIRLERSGFRVLLGGKLGRHPQLASELDGIYSPDQVIDILDRTVRHFKEHGGGPRRLGEILNETGLDYLKF